MRRSIPTDPAALLAELPHDVPAVAVRDGSRWVVAAWPVEMVRASGPEIWSRLDRLGEGWWAGFVSYDAGRSVERTVSLGTDDLGLPDILLARFRARVTIDISDGTAELHGEGVERSELERALQNASDRPAEPAAPGLRHWSSSLSRPAFEAGVRSIVELLHAGDCYQVNLTRRLTCSRRADPVALFAALLRQHPAPHAAFLRFGDVAVVSSSPERFLLRDADLVETRPIKGTGTDARALSASAKDRAENVMIVDLARNDLGRVCAYGSIDVPALCAPEAHPGLHHLVSTVRGRLRPGTGNGELLRAVFPPASVTGAPKPRVMQIIEDLEPVRRGVYCGAVGWIDNHDATRPRLDFNVAIRTFTVVDERTMLGVGGGVVADSDPRREWQETELKAARLLNVAGADTLVGAGA